jgi:hypothetical protein
MLIYIAPSTNGGVESIFCNELGIISGFGVLITGFRGSGSKCRFSGCTSLACSIASNELSSVLAGDS